MVTKPLAACTLRSFQLGSDPCLAYEAAGTTLRPVNMHRHTVNRLSSLVRLQAPQRCALIVCRSQATKAGEPKATPALLDKMNDKELLKVQGFIGGQWVSASDGTIMDVSIVIHVEALICIGMQLPSSTPTRHVMMKLSTTCTVLVAGQKSSYW